MASTSASASFVNLRSSFMNQSPPGNRDRYALPPVNGYHSHSHSGSGRERETQHPSLLSASLHRHHSASALPPGAHGPAYATTYQSSAPVHNRHHSQTPPAYYHSPYEYDQPATRKRRSSTNGSRISLLGGAAADPSPSSSEPRRLRDDSTGVSDHGRGSGTNSPHITPRTSLRMTPAPIPSHTPSSAAGTHKRQQYQPQHGFAVPGQSPGGLQQNTLPSLHPQTSSTSSSVPNADPSAVRRLAHLQCEQRRREGPNQCLPHGCDFTFDDRLQVCARRDISHLFALPAANPEALDFFLLTLSIIHRSINGGFTTLRSILPETTNADSKAAILQKAINYIQNLEQVIRASGGKIENAVILSTPDAPSSASARKIKNSSLSTSTSEVTSPSYSDPRGTSEEPLRTSPWQADSARTIDNEDDAMSPIRDAVEDMAVDMELEEASSTSDTPRRPSTTGKRGALYMLGSVASAAAAAVTFDSKSRTNGSAHPHSQSHDATALKQPGSTTSSMRNRLGFLKPSASADAVTSHVHPRIPDEKHLDMHEEMNKVDGVSWQHVERARV
ncbi:hypothetical protein QFC22_004964 [Naganishia vaughanmartiniae]|uniref:Uncharacterized protein n=1 Tax=Naganishia vaughanmartiniae TaxID=1424756 RepID=A0ACC2WVM1_9TREE|nr:hypothetical protein QFC22_004964 [Naganishia vaughanmartiniae]